MEIKKISDFRPRKLIISGGTFVISLPIFWVKSNGFKKGDDVPVELLSDGSLLIPQKARK